MICPSSPSKIFALVSLFLLLFTSCSTETTEKQAVEDAALQSFTTLLDGRYEDYASMLAGAQQRSSDYNEQMAMNAEMFIEQQQQLHTNIVDVRVSDVQMDKLPSRANAFIVLCYADSTNEEIVVPLIKENGTWKVQ